MNPNCKDIEYLKKLLKTEAYIGNRKYLNSIKKKLEAIDKFYIKLKNCTESAGTKQHVLLKEYKKMFEIL